VPATNRRSRLCVRTLITITTAPTAELRKLRNQSIIKLDRLLRSDFEAPKPQEELCISAVPNVAAADSASSDKHHHHHHLRHPHGQHEGGQTGRTQEDENDRGPNVLQQQPRRISNSGSYHLHQEDSNTDEQAEHEDQSQAVDELVSVGDPAILHHTVDRESDAAESTVVDSCLVMQDPLLILAACSDGYIRFWDVEYLSILCSCIYYHKPETSEPDPDPHSRHPHPHASHSAHQKAHHKMSHAHTKSHAEPGMKHKDKRASEKVQKNKRITTEKCKHIKLNGEEDRLIGAFDAGIIRIWVVVTHSLVTQQKLLRIANHSQVPVHRRVAVGGGVDIKVDGAEGVGGSMHGVLGAGMTIAPLQLLFEWEAHPSPIISIAFVRFETEGQEDVGDNVDEQGSPVEGRSPGIDADNEGLGTKRQRNRQQARRRHNVFVEELHTTSVDDGFIVSSGLDQQVILWTLLGECIGRYGSELWDINDVRTWSSHNALHHEEGTDGHSDSSGKATTVILESTLSSNAPILKKIKIPNENEKRLLMNKRLRYRSAQAVNLGTYVHNLVQKIQARPPLSSQQNQHFCEIMKHHPVINVDKFIADDSRFIASGIAKRMSKFKS
jgi:hypothetical protein